MFRSFGIQFSILVPIWLPIFFLAVVGGSRGGRQGARSPVVWPGPGGRAGQPGRLPPAVGSRWGSWFRVLQFSRLWVSCVFKELKRDRIWTWNRKHIRIYFVATPFWVEAWPPMGSCPMDLTGLVLRVNWQLAVCQYFSIIYMYMSLCIWKCIFLYSYLYIYIHVFTYVYIQWHILHVIITRIGMW